MFLVLSVRGWQLVVSGRHENLLTTVKRRKLQWYGHISRSSGLAEAILQGTVKGSRIQSRQRKRWEDNIREWTGLEFAESKGQWRTGKNGVSYLVSRCFEPSQSQRIRPRLNTNFTLFSSYSFPKSLYHKSCF